MSSPIVLKQIRTKNKKVNAFCSRIIRYEIENTLG